MEASATLHGAHVLPWPVGRIDLARIYRDLVPTDGRPYLIDWLAEDTREADRTAERGVPRGHQLPDKAWQRRNGRTGGCGSVMADAIGASPTS
jgi:hypothetical protein